MIWWGIMSRVMQCIGLSLALPVGCAIALAGSTVAAENGGTAPVPNLQAAAEQGPVAQALSKARVMNGPVNLAADYYIYVQSASWCGPCKVEMPELVKLYPQMKAANVELILVGQDGTEQAAMAYLQSFGAPFPGVHYQDEALKALPGYTLSRTVPHATLVDKQGRLIAKGHGSLARKWQQIIEDDREEEE